MSALLRPAALTGLVSVAVLIAACSGSAGSSGRPSGSPVTSPSVEPTRTPADAGAIDHPTGATDVILRYDLGGGFVMPSYLASQAPIFTLYGDGTVIFRNPAQEAPAPIGNVFRYAPFRTARLSEEQIQATLQRALVEGGLGTARLNYENNQVADAPTSTFTIDAGGVRKTVSVYALGLEVDGSADAVSRQAFASLADDLADFDQGGSIETQVYIPQAYRGILLEGVAGDPDARAWPWDDIAPTDFVAPSDPNSFGLPQRVMTPAEIDALGIDDHEGGWQGMTLRTDDGAVSTFSLRPLLPDDPTT
jgi:hypothetical protein